MSAPETTWSLSKKERKAWNKAERVTKDDEVEPEKKELSKAAKARVKKEK